MNHPTSKIKILVVEDEIILAEDIALRLRNMNYDVVGIAASAQQAKNILSSSLEVDIIIMDIMIKGDEDGIELAAIVCRKYKLPFIFLTSHSDNAILERARQVNPYAYLLKPFNDKQISIAIELALVNFSRQSSETDLLKNHQFAETENTVLKIKDSLFLKKNNRFERVLLNEIQFLEADSNYTTIYTQNGKFVYTAVLKQLESRLPKDRFLRVHRSFIVNIQAVQAYQGNVLYIESHKILVSKSHKEEVFRLFRTV
jgi:DNA-binding LytR/AlgR family response regulator